MAQLLKAVSHGQVEKVEQLLTKENINFQNKKGQTAVHVAISESHVEILDLLLQKSPDLTLVEKRHGYTPLNLALAEKSNSYVTFVDMLLTTSGNKDSPLLSQVYVPDHDGCTAFHLAAKYELREGLELLLAATKDDGSATSPYLNMKDGSGRTPLHVAASQGSLECLSVLLQSSDIHATDSVGNTALHWAAISESENVDEMVRTLLTAGALPSASNKSGNTALHSEGMHCDPDDKWPSAAATLMLEVDPTLATVKNASGNTPEELYAAGDDVVDTDSREVKVQAANYKPTKKKNTLTVNAARAAAIANTKKGKKVAKDVDKEPEKSSSVTMLIVISIIVMLFAILYSFLASLENK